MPPRDVRVRLDRAVATLTGRKLRAARFLRANHRTAFAMSVQELARAAEVSEATLVRLARDLGYAGYHELRGALMAEARRQLAPGERFALEPPAEAASETALRVARQEVDNINRTVAELDRAALTRAVGRLRRADPAVTVGLGVSALLARIAAYELFQVGVRAHALGRDTLTLAEQIVCLPRRAVVLAFGFRPYSRQTVDAVRAATRRALPVVAITDDGDAPIARDAEAVLIARTDSVLYTNSLAGPLVVVSALATDLALADKARALAHVAALERAAAPDLVGDPE